MTCSVRIDPFCNAHTGPIDLGRPHFAGIGGVAMSALARLCLARGSRVSGSDITETPALAALRAAGCQVGLGHDPARITAATCVVYTAVTAQSSEVVAAREAGIPVVHRAQVLAALAAGQRLIAVTGTHGKSTTSGILATALQGLGADPSYVIGANLNRDGVGARHGCGGVLVAEADESDRSFLFLEPDAAVVTCIAHDHPENYVDLADHVEAYTRFASGIRDNGFLVVNVDDPGAAQLVDRIRRAPGGPRVVTYGEQDADLLVLSIVRQNWSTTITVDVPASGPVTVTVPTPSADHARDAAGALAALIELGYDPHQAAAAISLFQRVPRRLDRIGHHDGISVVDSYADHPNEILADLKAVRAAAGGHKVIVVFQPSGHHRVRAFGRQMGEILAREAHEVIMLGVHGIDRIEGVDSSIIAESCLVAGGSVHSRVTAGSTVADLAAELAAPGDFIVTMGTGDVTTYGRQVLAALRTRSLIAA